MKQETIDAIKKWQSGLTDHNAEPKALLITGVMASGKSTLARAIVETLGKPFFHAIPAHIERCHGIQSRIIVLDLHNNKLSPSNNDHLIQLMYDDDGGQIENDNKVPTNRFAVIILSLDANNLRGDLLSRCEKIVLGPKEFYKTEEDVLKRLKTELRPILIG